MKYFEGTPIPSSLLLVMLMFMAALQGALGDSMWLEKIVLAGFTLHPLVLLFAISGSLMVSRIHFLKFCAATMPITQAPRLILAP